MLSLTPQQLIDHYQLQPHPEGGWYRETYRSAERLAVEALPDRFDGERVFATAIYFLIEQGNFSAFHRIKSDECWHFYYGDPLEVLMLEPSGALSIVRLGCNMLAGEVFQFVVPANCWFASRPAKESTCCFVGCTVAPGFSFSDFEMADAVLLSKAFPQHAPIIHELCR